MRKILPLFVLLMTTATAAANATGYTEYFTYGTSFGTNVFAGTNSFEQTTNNYHSEAYVEYDNEHADINGGVDIELTEYEQGKFSVTFKRFTTGFSIYGDLTIDNLTATTSDKGTTYNVTDASKAVWKSITPVGIMSGLSENGESTFSNFTCTIDSDNNIFLSYNVDLAGSDVKVVVGKAQPVTTSYNGELVVKDSLTAETLLEQKDAQTEITVNANSTASLTMKNVTLGKVSGDITFTGTYVVAEEDGENVFTLQGVSDEATTALFGAELKCAVKGTYSKEDEASYTFEMFNETKSIHYVGMFAKNAIATGINNISTATSATSAQIFNVSGVKVSGLQKGINIVRTADGKTVKVLCK